MAEIPAAKADVIDYVKRRVAPGVLYGLAIVKTLQPEDYDGAWADAVVWYVGLRGIIRSTTLTLSPGTSEYAAPADLDQIVEVIPPGPVTSFQYQAAELGVSGAAIPLYGGYGFGAKMPLSDMVIDTMHSEQMRRMLAVDVSVSYDRDLGKLVVLPSTSSGMCVVRYRSTSFDIAKLPVKERAWVRDYALASTLDRLGTIYSKYEGGIPAAGDQIQLSTRLKDDATLMIGTLNEAIATEEPAAITAR